MGGGVRSAVLVFAKYPTPGRVKSRLVPALTEQQAAAVHAACLRAVWSWVGDLAGVEPVLVCSPDDAGPGFTALLGPVAQMWPQGNGDLGDRLGRAFARGVAEGFGRIVAVGCDSPTLVSRRVPEALAALAAADAVMGPTEDGGYYLIGAAPSAEPLFPGVDWGTERVAAQTRERAAAARLRLAELPVGYDVDRPADLERLRAELDVLDSDPIAARLAGELVPRPL